MSEEVTAQEDRDPRLTQARAKVQSIYGTCRVGRNWSLDVATGGGGPVPPALFFIMPPGASSSDHCLSLYLGVCVSLC